MLRPGQNSTSFPPTWNHGKTQTIRVPIALAKEILDYARTVDSKLINDLFQDIPLYPGDFLQQRILEIIDRYIEYKRQNYHPNQNSREVDTSTRAWDELRKLRQLLQECPDLLRH